MSHEYRQAVPSMSDLILATNLSKHLQLATTFTTTVYQGEDYELYTTTTGDHFTLNDIVESYVG